MNMMHTYTSAHPATRSGWLLPVIYLAAGAVTGGLLAVLPPAIGIMAAAALLGAALAVLYPLPGLYLLTGAFIIVTDIRNYGHPIIWPLRDIDVVTGLPSALWMFFLLLFTGTMFRFYVVDRKRSILSVVYLWIYIAILASAYVTGLLQHWNPSMRQTDLLNFLFPAIFIYLCVNLLDTRARICRILWYLFAISVINAVILCGFFLAGHGVEFTLGAGQPVSRVVTLDSGSLLSCITMSLVIVAWMMSGRLSPSRTLMMALGATPLLFVVIFSYRRAEWIGLTGGLTMLYLIGTPRERGRFVRAALTGFMLLALSGSIAAQGVGTAGVLHLLHGRVETITSAKHTPNQHHLFEPLQTFKDISRQPVFAMGLGGEHGPIPQFPHDTVPRHVVHNTWLYVWMKLGLSGFLLLLAVSVGYLRHVRDYLRHPPDAPGRPMIMALIALIPTLFMLFMTGPVPWYPHQMCLIVLFTSLTVNLIKTESEATL